MTWKNQQQEHKKNFEHLPTAISIVFIVFFSPPFYSLKLLSGHCRCVRVPLVGFLHVKAKKQITRNVLETESATIDVFDLCLCL